MQQFMPWNKLVTERAGFVNMGALLILTTFYLVKEINEKWTPS